MTPEQNIQTLIGVFDDHAAAKRAALELTQAGISSASINIESGDSGPDDGKSASSKHEGGFAGWFARLASTDGETASESGHYAEALRKGHAILSASVPQAEVASTTDIMDRNGAMAMDRLIEKWKQTGSSVGEKTSIPVIEEELQVGKRTLQRGGVRVYSRIVDQPVEEQVNLREEHARIERRPVNREITAEEMDQLQDQVIEVTEIAEEIVVSKRARVVEEIVVGKEATEHTETVRESVRHTEVVVDELS